jgi:ATP-binding cassette subfamily F protein uup
VQEYVGGYEDWVRQRPRATGASTGTTTTTPRPIARDDGQSRPRKLSYKEQQEYDQLPARIEALESEQKQLQADIAGPLFYTRPAAEITQTLARLEALDALLLESYARWDALDSRRLWRES